MYYKIIIEFPNTPNNAKFTLLEKTKKKNAWVEYAIREGLPYSVKEVA